MLLAEKIVSFLSMEDQKSLSLTNRIMAENLVKQKLDQINEKKDDVSRQLETNSNKKTLQNNFWV